LAALKARNGDYPEAEYNAAVLLGDQGHYEEAADLYRTLLKRDPANEDAKANLRSAMQLGSAALMEQGKDAYEQGDFDTARKAWSRALKLDPDNAEAGRLLKQAQSKVSASEAAASAARRSAREAVARRLEAEDDKVKSRGLAAYKVGKLSEAVRLLDFYLKKNPGDKGAQTVLVKARGRLRATVEDDLKQAADALAAGNRDQASALAARALELDNGNARAEQILKTAGQAPEKKVDQEAVRKLYYYGVEQYLAGDLAGAVGTWKKVLSQVPDHLDAQRSLARAELELAELKKRGKG
jgi:tetratricopeptide (TPR) repeat protein